MFGRSGPGVCWIQSDLGLCSSLWLIPSTDPGLLNYAVIAAVCHGSGQREEAKETWFGDKVGNPLPMKDICVSRVGHKHEVCKLQDGKSW